MAPNWRRRSGGSQNSWTSQRLEAGIGIEKSEFYDRESDWEDEDDTPSFGSRVTSGSAEPMLGKASTAYSQPKKSYFFVTRLPAGSVTRWLCLGLTAIMVGFILILLHASWASARRVDFELSRGGSGSKKPFHWQSYAPSLRFYGGLQSLVTKSDNIPEYPLESSNERNETLAAEDLTTLPRRMKIFNPYPNYKSDEYVTRYGRKVDCFLDAAGKVTVPSIHMHEGVPRGMPDPAMGSAEVLGLRDDICYDRLGRLGPYGLGYSLARGGSGASLNGDRTGADEVWSEVPEVDWRNVKWAEIQERCVRANSHRFKPLPEQKLDRAHTMPIGAKHTLSKRVDEEEAQDSPIPPIKNSVRKKLPRTAVIIRTWHDFQYTTESVVYLRSLISELSLHSGGEYHVHFLVHVKDNNIPIWSDDWMYERMINESLPEEFRGMGTLWTERQMHLVYGDLEESMMRNLPVHGVYRSTFMPLQYFAHNHPEYDFFWHWEMDARYTGHYYHLFESLAKWAKEQPRKNLWERNSRFYVPSEHGSWEDFSHTVRVQTEQGTNSPNNMWTGLNKGSASKGQTAQPVGDKPIWGPEPPLDDDVSLFTDIHPPTTFKEDRNTWGVGEEADLISLNPLFDPEGTTWLLAEDVTGYNRTRGFPPRRVSIITAARLSQRLLSTMHHETGMLRHTMFSEMWPASCALHHGYKAVYAPHPVFIERQWPTSTLSSTFNGGKNGATGAARTSVFGDREHNFSGTTWYYNAAFPLKIWNRWLGYKFDKEGGEDWETSQEGRMCLPGMLLHPVKEVKLVQEGRKWGDEEWTGGGWHEP